MPSISMSRIELGDAQKIFRAGLRERRRRGLALRSRHAAVADSLAAATPFVAAGSSLARLAASAQDGTQELDRLRTDARAWFQGIDRFVYGYTGRRTDLQAPMPQEPAFPVSILAGAPRAWHDPEGWLSWIDAAIHDGLSHIDALLAASETEPPRKVRASQYRFEELRVAGLIHADQLAGYIGRMRHTRSKQEISEAIGGAKELTEACYLAAGELLALSGLPKDDFPKLGKTVRAELVKRALSPKMTRKATAAIVQLGTGLGTVDDALAAIRNELGTGHGRAHPPAGLRSFHADLAIDAAEMQTRYLIGVLRELGLLDGLAD